MNHAILRPLGATTRSPRLTLTCTALLAFWGTGCGSIVEEHPGGGSASSGTTSTGGSSVGGCGAGKITTIAEGQGNPAQIVVDATHVYWRDGAMDKEVRSVAKTGGAPTVLVTGQAFVDAIAVDAEHVYWAGTADPKSSTDEVYAVAKTGGASTKLATTQAQIAAIASDQENLYLTTYSGYVLSVPKTGGTPTVLLADPHQNMRDAIVDDARVYWSDDGASRIMSIPKIGGDPSVFAEPVAVFLEQIGHDENRLYWNYGNTIFARSKAAPSYDPLDVIASTKEPSGRVAVDATCVYWATYHTESAVSTLWAAPKSGGDATQISEEANDTVSLAVDETGVYWADQWSGAIKRLEK